MVRPLGIPERSEGPRPFGRGKRNGHINHTRNINASMEPRGVLPCGIRSCASHEAQQVWLAAAMSIM